MPMGMPELCNLTVRLRKEEENRVKEINKNYKATPLLHALDVAMVLPLKGYVVCHEEWGGLRGHKFTSFKPFFLGGDFNPVSPLSLAFGIFMAV